MRGFNYQEAVADLLRLLHDSPPEGQHVAVQSLGEISSNRHPGWQNHADLDMQLITRVLDSIWAATGSAGVSGSNADDRPSLHLRPGWHSAAQ